MQGSITSGEGRACQSSAIVCFRQAAGLQSDCPSAFPWYQIALSLSTVPEFPRHLIIPILARCVSDRLSFNFSISISLGKVKIFLNHFEKNMDVYTNPSMFLLFSRKVVSDSLRPRGLYHARLPCLPLSPGICSNSCPLSQWCHPTILSSVIPFSSCLQSFLASGSFLMSRLFTSGGQSIGASASTLVLLVNNQGWFLLGLTGLTSLQSKGLSRVFSRTWTFNDG